MKRVPRLNAGRKQLVSMLGPYVMPLAANAPLSRFFPRADSPFLSTLGQQLVFAGVSNYCQRLHNPQDELTSLPASIKEGSWFLQACRKIAG